MKDYFEDVDGNDTIEKYTATSSTHHVIVEKVAANKITLDVSKKVGSYFELTIHAIDDKKATSTESLKLKVRTVNPRSETVKVEQFSDGSFLAAEIGNRQGVTHYLAFQSVVINGTASTGFVFDGVDVNTATYVTARPSATANTLRHYTISTTGPVKIDAAPDNSNPPLNVLAFGTTAAQNPGDSPVLRVKVTGVGSATITINFHASEDVPNQSGSFRWKKTKSSTLKLTVKRIS